MSEELGGCGEVSVTRLCGPNKTILFQITKGDKYIQLDAEEAGYAFGLILASILNRKKI